MKKLFSGLLRLIETTRRILLNVVFVIVVLLVVSSLMLAKPSVPDHALLVINPQGKLVEQLEAPNTDLLSLSAATVNQTRVKDIIDAIRAARNDENVVALRLDLAALAPSSISKLQMIRDAIIDFKSSGKPVVAAGYSFSQTQYYLAAEADKLFLHPMGMIEITGLSVYRNYFKDALDKLNIDVHVFRVGKYKSAIEPFTRNNMSEASRQANRAWMEVIWDAYKQDIANMRNIDAQHLQEVLDHPVVALQQYQGDLAAMLKAEGLVDELGDSESAERYLAAEVKWADESPMPEIDYKHYLQAYTPAEEQDSDNHIAVITASGPILNGEQPSGTVGGDTLAALLRDARLDESVKAVVLRIDSPGGSALASEVIRQSMLRLQQSGKPVVVSMGSVAASGGYWIAASANEIWAQPTTITGSIGVFGMVPNFNRSLNKLGIHTDGLGSSKLAGALRADKPLSKSMQQLIQMGVEHTYKNFLTLVSEGRGISLEEVDKLAQGRVWSGLHARASGLIDKLGGLEDAIVSAAAFAKVQHDYRIDYIEPPKGFRELVSEVLFGESSVMSWTREMLGIKGYTQVQPSLMAQLLEPWLQQSQMLLRLNDPNHVYAFSNISEQ